MTDVVYDNWGVEHAIDRLYTELPIKYTLTTSASTIEISEPIGWSEVNIVHKRDKQYHGFNYEFTDENLALGFDTEAGMEGIQAEYDLYGSDGTVLLKKIAVWGAEEIIEYEGRLNLNVLKEEEYYLRCMVKRSSLHQLIGPRLNTKLNLFEGKTLDEEEFTPPVPVRCLLTSRVISQTFRNNVYVAESTVYSKAKDGDLWLYFNSSSPQVSQIQTTTPQRVDVSEFNPVTNGQCLFRFASAGSYNFTVRLHYQFSMSIQPRFISLSSKRITGYTLKTQVIHVRPGKTQQAYAISAPVSGTPSGTNTGNITVDGTYSGYLEVEAGDELYINGAFTFTHNANEIASLSAYLSTYTTEIEFIGNSIAGSTTTQGLLIKDVMETALKKLTGESGVFRSSYYGLASESQPVDGCGALRMITNGGSLRKATGGKFPLTVSFSDQLSDIHAIDGVGMGYEWDGVAQKEVVRVEPFDYFYQDVEIMELTDIGNYREETANELLYNQVDVGYEKYNEEGANSLDEVHAYHEYQTPIQTENNKYSIKSKSIASAYLLETTRRAQFSKDEKQATTYDDDNFIIHLKEGEFYGGVFDMYVTEGSPTSTIYLYTKPVADVNVGDQLTIESTFYNNGTYTVTDVYDHLDLTEPVYQIEVEPPFAQTETGTLIGRLRTYEYQPVHDEPFASVTGLISPETAYNLTLTPKRMLLPHSKWLLSGLSYKPGNKIIKNTFTKQNGELTTQLATDYSCTRGDTLGLAMQEKADIALSAFGYAESLFSPEWMYCTARMSMQQIRYLISALRGMNQEGKNYGYVSLTGSKGRQLQGWVYEISFTPTKEEAHLKLLKKKIRQFTP